MRVCIVGAGIAGCTAAVLLSRLGHRVEVFETRDHIGGNCFDEWIDGILVHRYGPHGFHTDKKAVWDFLSDFTDFRPTAFEVVAETSLGRIPVPFNDVSASIVGELSPERIRDLVFRDYSEKHWGVPWERLPASIRGRLPLRRHSADSRYHLDRWQGVPSKGYHEMFRNMLDGVTVHVGAEPDAWRGLPFDHVVYTGSVDEYFRCGQGVLGYRSLEFRHEREPKRPEFQINECNTVRAWTRSIDHSHWLDQKVSTSVISYEHPVEWRPGGVRMYPKPFDGNPEKHALYRVMAAREKRVTFAGRLATYRYLDMDDAVAQTTTFLKRFPGAARLISLPPGRTASQD